MKVNITGNVKDVMKESVMTALAFLQTHFVPMPALNANWNNLEVFLHFPAAAVSKDGPSAGIAILSALLSSFYAVPVN